MILAGCLKPGCEKFVLCCIARVRTLSKEWKKSSHPSNTTQCELLAPWIKAAYENHAFSQANILLAYE
jgi:hypothetical protein